MSEKRNYKTVKIEDPALVAAIEKRTTTKYGQTFNGVANTIAGRYFDLIRESRNSIRRTFSNEELMAILDACNGVSFEPIGISVQGIACEIKDAIELDGLASKWKIDGGVLINKLENQNPMGVLALIDFIEYCWNNTDLDFSNGQEILRNL